MLNIETLSVERHDGVLLLHAISMRLRRGEAVGLTGASGAGKSTLLKAIMGILDPQCRIVGGSVVLDGREKVRLDRLPAKRRRSYAGTTIGYIPQQPMSAFDSRLGIGVQMEETFRVRLALDRRSAMRLSAEMLARVGLDDTDRVLQSLPGGLSGGMLQRVAIAMLLGLNPPIVLADEPTASLDEDSRSHVLSLLGMLVETSALLFVSHDSRALDTLCSDVAVLHCGEAVERGSMAQLLQRPTHSWTKSFAERYRAAQSDVGKSGMSKPEDGGGLGMWRQEGSMGGLGMWGQEEDGWIWEPCGQSV